MIARAETMEILGRDDKRTLTGFTKPIQRAVRELVEAGEDLPEGEVFPFVAVYDGAPRAQGFRIRPAALNWMRSAIENLR